ncbi:nucleoside/nucleotide kinase family protein [Pseudaestuariivita sp.]|uniref:nucleoside/nucleotide kinase family protein n=1 Tax=Pseudaestuariivita sp. TaxID=2211669 RepID=UPI00405919FA
MISAPQELLDRIARLRPDPRVLIGIAGAPGAGKSTLAEAVAKHLNTGTPGQAAVLGMDGFHFDDRVLAARGDLPRKGAPHTFDVGGLAAMLGRLRTGDEDVAVPVFDRSIEIARAGAEIIPASVPIVLVEGNYILTDQGDWAALREAFDLRVLVDVEAGELERRLRERWQGLGLGPAALEDKLRGNDLPNGAFVLAHSVGVDVVVREEAL